ncbi:hypothetical protein CR513_35620, partial [Mucuna pruriens]
MKEVHEGICETPIGGQALCVDNIIICPLRLTKEIGNSRWRDYEDDWPEKIPNLQQMTKSYPLRLPRGSNLFPRIMKLSFSYFLRPFPACPIIRSRAKSNLNGGGRL